MSKSVYDEIKAERLKQDERPVCPDCGTALVLPGEAGAPEVLGGETVVGVCVLFCGTVWTEPAEGDAKGVGYGE